MNTRINETIETWDEHIEAKDEKMQCIWKEWTIIMSELDNAGWDEILKIAGNMDYTDINRLWPFEREHLKISAKGCNSSSYQIKKNSLQKIFCFYNAFNKIQRGIKKKGKKLITGSFE